MANRSKRFVLDDFPWDKVEKTRAFITRLFSGEAAERLAAIVHPALIDRPQAEAPAGATEWQRQVWQAQESLRRRPIGRDDFVPALGTWAGTCALATAFGCVEIQTSGVYWPRPCVTRMEEIDALRKPALTAGKLGQVLEQTRAYAACADERLAIRIMDFQSPFTTVEQMLGSGRFFLMPYDEPQRLHALMDVVTDFAIDFFSAQIAAAGPNYCPGSWPAFWFPRCAGIQMSDDNLVNVSPDTYAEFVVPYNNRIAAAFGGLFLHSCTIKEPHLPVLHELKGLTGINCDISTSVSPARLLEEFGDDSVVAPHAYINTDTNFKNYAEFTETALAGWRPGKRLFIYPCTVLYQPDTSQELPFNEAETRAVLERIPA
ncbi:MAG: uroporphyrinogen decarboxylase family protein, partial [Planctomycetota bacterium]